MANSKPAVSFDDIIQRGRKKQKNELLAQRLLGSRRSSAPANAPKALTGSLASRVGINKVRPRTQTASRAQRQHLQRTSSVPRTASPRGPRAPAAQADSQRSRPSRLPKGVVAAQPAAEVLVKEEVNGGDGVYIRGAARGAYTVVASNFAPGTTAADIESVMEGVGGGISRCILIASSPTVIAEMDFQDKTGAEKVIDTFNGKKADGRVLHVYTKGFTGAKPSAPVEPPAEVVQAVPVVPQDVPMEMDPITESRETQDRLREERRVHDDSANFPTGPRNAQPADRGGYYDRRPRPQHYQGGRYAPSGGDRYGGDGGYGRYYDDSRRYGGGQGWR